jgi:hypothetical protein
LAQLKQGRVYADGWPAAPSDMIASNYYDLAYTLYQIYYRTQDSYWLARARQVAQDWLQVANIRALHACVTAQPTDWDLCGQVPPARSIALMGPAVLAAEDGQAAARQLLNDYAAFLVLKGLQAHWLDERENGYMLLYLAASVALGDDHRALARQFLDTALAHQSADGSFVGTYSYPYGSSCVYHHSENFMNGILGEGLILYDRVIGDARIVPALRALANWLWTTQWQAAKLGFRYSPPESAACIPGGDAQVLNGLFLPIWGYLYERTSEALYQTQGDQILQGLVQYGFGGISGVKQFNQAFRSSGHYLGAIDAP